MTLKEDVISVNGQTTSFETDLPQTTMRTEFPDVSKQSETSAAPAACAKWLSHYCGIDPITRSLSHYCVIDQVTQSLSHYCVIDPITQSLSHYCVIGPYNTKLVPLLWLWLRYKTFTGMSQVCCVWHVIVLFVLSSVLLCL